MKGPGITTTVILDPWKWGLIFYQFRLNDHFVTHAACRGSSSWIRELDIAKLVRVASRPEFVQLDQGDCGLAMLIAEPVVQLLERQVAGGEKQYGEKKDETHSCSFIENFQDQLLNFILQQFKA